MGFFNEIERAELLHKELYAAGRWPLHGPPRGRIQSELLLVLSRLYANCSNDFFTPNEVLALLQQLIADAQFLAESRSPRIDPSALWQEYAVLKKHFLVDTFSADDPGS
jgi:hypothetical protein